MADNVTVDNGGLTDYTAATDEIGGAHFQRIKLDLGAEGASDPQVGSVSIDDGGGSITVDGTVSTTLGAGTNNIGDVDVLTLPALPAGTNNIGDVDVLTLPALPAGTNNIGDVDVLSSALPTGAATSANQTTELASLAAIESDADAIRIATQLIDDGIQVLGTDTYTEATSKGMTIGAVRRDADTTLVNTTNEFGPLQMDANGRLKVESFSGETLPVSLATLPALVAGTANIGDVDVLTLPALPAGTNNIGDVDVLTLPALPAGTNNIGDVDILTIAAGDNNIGNVDIVTMPNVTLAAGTNTNEVVGDIAHDIGVGGNPVLIAGAAQDSDDTAPPNRVSAESDTTRFATDRDGAIFVRTHGPQSWTYHENSSSALTDTSVHAAPGAGLSLYVGTIVVSTGAATAFNIFFEEGASTVMGPYYLEAVAGRGFAIQFNPPRKITANTALTVTTSAAIAHSIDITGFTAQG